MIKLIMNDAGHETFDTWLESHQECKIYMLRDRDTGETKLFLLPIGSVDDNMVIEVERK